MLFNLFKSKKKLKTVDASQIRHRLYKEEEQSLSHNRHNSYHQLAQKSQLQQKSLEKKIDRILKENSLLKKRLKQHNIQLIRSYPLYLFVRNITCLFSNKPFICFLLTVNIILFSNILFYQHQYTYSDAPYGYSQLPKIITLPFTIAFGQYLSLDDILLAQKQLKKIGFESQIFLIKNQFYTLYIGYYPTPSQAHTTLRQLHKNTFFAEAQVLKRF